MSGDDLAPSFRAHRKARYRLAEPQLQTNKQKAFLKTLIYSVLTSTFFLIVKFVSFLAKKSSNFLPDLNLRTDKQDISVTSPTTPKPISTATSKLDISALKKEREYTLIFQKFY